MGDSKNDAERKSVRIRLSERERGERDSKREGERENKREGGVENKRSARPSFTSFLGEQQVCN